jgi:hypothetical protein
MQSIQHGLGAGAEGDGGGIEIAANVPGSDRAGGEGAGLIAANRSNRRYCRRMVPDHAEAMESAVMVPTLPAMFHVPPDRAADVYGGEGFAGIG